MTASATNKLTGEVTEYKVDTPEQIVTALRQIGEAQEVLKELRKQVADRATELIDKGERLEHDGFLVRSFTTQKMTYDKGMLRQVFDEDTLDLFLQPAKGRIDMYIRDHLAELGENSTRLRESMIPVGRRYSVTRVERLDRPEGAV